MSNVLTRQIRRAAWILGATLAAALLFTGGFAVRLLMGPISLGPFAGAIEDSVNSSISGLTVRFDQAVLEWSGNEGRINLIILGTKVFDSGGRIVAQAPKADLDISVVSLLRGHLSLQQISLIGVQLTGERTADGKLHIGFGTGPDSPDIMETLSMALANGNGEAGSLQAFAIRDARFAFNDQPSGLFVISPHAALGLRIRNGQQFLELDGLVEIAGVASAVKAAVVLRNDGMPKRGAAEIRGLSLPALSNGNPKLAVLDPYQLVADVFADFVSDSEGRIASVAFHSTGAGRIDTKLMRGPLELDHYDLAGVYTAEGGRVKFETINVEGKQVSGTARAELATMWTGDELTSLSGEIAAENLKLAWPEWFDQPLVISSASFRGGFDAPSSTLQWERMALRAGPLTGRFSGKAVFAPSKAPGLKISGTVDPIPARTLMRYWPKTVGQGAYNWIDGNILDGRLGPATIEIDLPVGAMDSQVTSDEGVSVGFPFEDATIRYMAGMSPITAARGSAVLSGKTFKAEISQGAVGPIALSGGDVLLEDIHIRGSSGFIKAHAEGKVPDVLSLIDEKPLGYPARFGLDPKSTAGDAIVDLSVVVPLRRDVTREEIGITVAVKAEKLSIPLDSRFQLRDAAATIDIDRSSLAAAGKGMLSGVPLQFNWTENFSAESDSTRIDASGVLDERSRPVFGLSQPDWVTGSMPFQASLFGHRFRFRDIAVTADATQAAAQFASVNLSKQAGVAAKVSALVHFQDKGVLSVRDLTVTGDGIEVRGELETDGARQFKRATLQRVRIGTENDFAADIQARGDGGLDVKVTGARLDARKLVAASKLETKKEDRPGVAPSNGPVEPLTIDAVVGHVALTDDFALSDVRFGISYAVNERIEGFSLDAVGPDSEKMSGRFAVKDGEREITLESGNAGNFVRGFTGFSSVNGGSLAARVALPKEPPAPHDPLQLNGTIVLSDIVISNQPFISRLFAAGSLDGPLRLLQGAGIPVTSFAAPFMLRDKQITIRDGRLAGPAIGATFEGTLNRETEAVDMTGSLVPVYSINSLLGALPVLGDLLVSKQGEGIFGLTYRMRGELSEPAIAVNPLSVLTPGIFRRIFEFATPKNMEPEDSAPGSGPK